MDKPRRSRSLASMMVPSWFKPSIDLGSLSASDTQMLGMVVFGFGRFQSFMLLCAQITAFVSYSQSIAAASDLTPVDHWCHQGSEYANVSADAWKETYLPRRPGGRGYDSCHRYEAPLAVSAPASAATEDPDAGNSTRAVVACDAWDYDTSRTGSTVLVYWDIVCHRTWYRYLIQVAFMFGGALSVPIAGLVSNRWGRRPVMWFSVCALLCACSATCVAPTLMAFVVLRFVASAAVSVLEVVSFVLLFESTPTGPREPFCALSICWPSVLAPVFVATLAYTAFSWRVIHAGLAVPALILVWTVYVTEESPHWLIVNHRFREARRVALWAAVLNDEDPDIVIERLEKVKEMLASSPTAVSRAESDGVGAANAVRKAEDATGMCKTATHLSYFRSRAMLAHCFVVFGCWFMVNVNYYYRSLEVPHVNLIKWIVIACNVPAMTIAYFIIKHHGRLTPLVVFLVAASVLLLFNTASRFLGLNFPPQLAIMWRILLLNIAYVLLCVHTVSLFPTQVRSVAFSWAYTFGRLGAIAAEAFQVVESGLRYDLGALPMGVAAVNLLVFSLLLLTLSDKKLLDIVTRVDLLNASAAPRPAKKRRLSPDSLFPRQ